MLGHVAVQKLASLNRFIKEDFRKAICLHLISFKRQWGSEAGKLTNCCAIAALFAHATQVSYLCGTNRQSGTDLAERNYNRLRFQSPLRNSLDNPFRLVVLGDVQFLGSKDSALPRHARDIDSRGVNAGESPFLRNLRVAYLTFAGRDLFPLSRHSELLAG